MSASPSSTHPNRAADVAVVGAGIIGIACAHYLMVRRPGIRIALIDPLPPMSVTSAASGENYRSLWPREEIGALTRRSISLMEDVVRATDNRISMTRRGYLYVSRDANPAAFATNLNDEYAHSEAGEFRIHESTAPGYRRNNGRIPYEADLDGVDVLCGSNLIGDAFPFLNPSINVAVHTRRAGDLSGQQLGQYFLECLAEGALTRITAAVTDVSESGSGLKISLDNGQFIHCENVINAAGPDTSKIAAMMNHSLPLKCVAQQKIAFVDRLAAVPRDAPFTIDLDGHAIDWPSDIQDDLGSDAGTKWLTEEFPGGIHCRPDGGANGERIKLGWAFNHADSQPEASPPLLDLFPELVIRGAARANPALAPYIEHLPAHVTHYGGYYTKTEENWPLIGPAGLDGAFVAAGLSGYGTMAACAVGELIAAWVCGDQIAPSMRLLGLERYQHAEFMSALLAETSSGEL